METAAECYAMAEQCESQAVAVRSPQARELLLDVRSSSSRRGRAKKAPPFDGACRFRNDALDQRVVMLPPASITTPTSTPSLTARPLHVPSVPCDRPLTLL